MDIMTMAVFEDLKNKIDGIERMLQEIIDKLECNGEMLEEILEEIRR